MARQIFSGAGALTGVIKLNVQDLPAKVKVKGLAGVETVDLQDTEDAGTTYDDIYEGGTQTQFTTTNTSLSIVAPGHYLLNKGVTAGTVTATISVLEDI